MRRSADWRLAIKGHTDDVTSDECDLDLCRSPCGGTVEAALGTQYGIEPEHASRLPDSAVRRAQDRNDTMEEPGAATAASNWYADDRGEGNDTVAGAHHRRAFRSSWLRSRRGRGFRPSAEIFTESGTALAWCSTRSGRARQRSHATDADVHRRHGSVGPEDQGLQPGACAWVDHALSECRAAAHAVSPSAQRFGFRSRTYATAACTQTPRPTTARQILAGVGLDRDRTSSSPPRAGTGADGPG